MKLLLAAILTSFCVETTASSLTVFADPVEPGQGWSGTNAFNSGFGRTEPIEGANMALFASQNAESYEKSFTGILLEEGVLTANFWVHNFINASTPANLDA